MVSTNHLSRIYSSTHNSSNCLGRSEVHPTSFPLTRPPSLTYIPNPGFIPADAVAAYGPSFISGVILLGSGIGPDDNFLSIIARPTVAELLTGLASTDVLEFRNATMAFSKSLYAPGYEIAFEEEQRVVGGLLIMVRFVCYLLERKTEPTITLAPRCPRAHRRA